MKAKARTVNAANFSADVLALNKHQLNGSEIIKPAKAPEMTLRMGREAKTRAELAVEALLLKHQAAGGIRSVEFEGVTLKIGAGVRYTPDFACIYHNGQFLFVEAKGTKSWEDALVKYKVAVGKYRNCRFQFYRVEKGNLLLVHSSHPLDA